MQPVERTAPHVAIGIDVGGTGIKGGRVDLRTGHVLGEVVRRRTPAPAIIGAVVPVIAEVAADLGAQQDPMPLGVALSGDVRDGRRTSGVNLHESWVDAPARDMLTVAIGREPVILNDADAAGLGEATWGAAAGVKGVVVLLTFGTGIGSAILLDGRLLPNSGFGQLPFHGRRVELLVSAVARERRGLSWERWARDVSEYLATVDELLRPELIVIGGGVTEAPERFWHLLRASCPLAPATLGNRAGIAGAARFAADATRDLHPANVTTAEPPRR